MHFRISKKKLILILLLAVFALCAFSACSKLYLPEDNGFTALVVYDANGGRFGNADSTGIRTFKYRPSVSIMEPGGAQNAQFAAPTMDGSHVVAWYPAELDENGEPRKDEQGQYILQSEPWDFHADRIPANDGFKLYLVARWQINYSLVVDVGEEARADGVENVVYSDYTEAGPVSQPGIDPEWDRHTFYYYYYLNEEGARVRLRNADDWATLTLSDETPQITVYVEWLTGVWNIIDSADQLQTISSQRNYILDADINMGGRSFGPVVNYEGTFDGNGHAIYNFATEDRQGGTERAKGLFSFRGNGSVRNVTFRDGSYSVLLTSRISGVDARFNVGFLCGDGSGLDLARFENISFIGCSLRAERMGAAAQIPVSTGEGSFAGVFGTVAQGAQFVPGPGSEAIAVEVI